MTERDEVWEPDPLPAETFHADDEININRAPHDRLSGVIFKRAMNIKRVRYDPVEPAPEMPDPWQGAGEAVVRWLLSEQPGTEEHLLAGRAFSFLQDVRLSPGASTGQRAHEAHDTVVYVIAGAGQLRHRPTEGSPVIVRPLRPGDLALIAGTELFSIANTSESEPLHLITLGLKSP